MMAHETSNNGRSVNPIASIVNTQFLMMPKAHLMASTNGWRQDTSARSKFG
jgi:hypothetical protein